MTEPSRHPEAIQEALKVSASLLCEAGVPFALAGGLACWVRGAGPSFHDVDYVVSPDQAEWALEVLSNGGLRIERPPEQQWLFKAYDDGGEMIDIIFNPSGPSPDAVIKEAEVLEVLGLRIPVMTATHVIMGKLASMSELHLDYHSILQVARSLREQIDWDHVRAETAESPFARAFFTMAEGLGVVEPGSSA